MFTHDVVVFSSDRGPENTDNAILAGHSADLAWFVAD